MPRPKTFDPDQALGEAMALFWAKGFATTSMADLEAHLGLGRVSLYGAFGDKRQLFLECLRKYRREVAAPLLQSLDDDDGLAAIRRFFAAIVGAPPAVRRRGCLIVNTLVAATEPDPAVDAIIGEHVRHVETRFVRAIRRGQAVGTIASHVRPRGSARLLVTLAHGTFALNRCGIAPDLTKAAIRTALDGLIA
jgi:TetR/AcrR family transcriptional repressor of nem operon